MTNQAAADLIARSNRLGADPKNTNYAGGNTSAKGTETDPVTGEPVELAVEPGTEHGHLNRPDEPAASATVERVAAWIDRGFEPAASDALAASDLTTTT